METMNFDFIIPEIAVGQKIDSHEFAQALREAGITHVLNLFAGDQETFWDGATFYLPQEDDGTPRSVQQIHQAIAHFDCVLRRRGTLYIHCQWGLGRAPAMCYAIMRAMGISREDAAPLINRRRPRCAKWSWEQYIPSIEQALSDPPKLMLLDGGEGIRIPHAQREEILKSKP